MSVAQSIGTRGGVAYAAHDGVSLLGDLYLPAGAGPFPALVAAHGGGWQGGARSAFQFWGPYLAARGYVLFAISYRVAKKGQKMFPQAVHDVLAGVQFVRGSAAQIKVDPARIGLLGASAGAHLASLAALGGESPLFKGAYPNDAHAAVSTRVKALIGVYGVYDLVEMWRRLPAAEPAREQYREFLGRRADGRSPALFRCLAHQLCDVCQQSDRRVLERRDRGRSRQPPGADRRVPAEIEAGQFLRAHLHRAGRAALLAQRPDRGAGKLFRLLGAPSHALPAGAAVTRSRRVSRRPR